MQYIPLVVVCEVVEPCEVVDPAVVDPKITCF